MAFLVQKLNELRARQGFSLIQVPSVASLSESAGLKVHFADAHGEVTARTPMAFRGGSSTRRALPLTKTAP